MKSIEILIDLLRTRVGAGTTYSSLAEDFQVSIQTVRRWLQILEDLGVVFPVRPYHRNISRSLLNEPKYCFYDTGAVEGDRSARMENVVATALLRELHYSEDTKGSRVALHCLRDKEKNEVDFLALVDEKPVLMVEVKVGDDGFSRSLFRFHGVLKETRAIQVVDDLSRKKHSQGIDMIPVHEFLAGLSF